MVVWACEAGCRIVRAVVQGVSALSGDEQGATTRLSRGATLSLLQLAGDADDCSG